MPKSRPITPHGRENTLGNAEIAPEQVHRAREYAWECKNTHAWECRNRARSGSLGAETERRSKLVGAYRSSANCALTGV
jgi:hypothetical protein